MMKLHRFKNKKPKLLIITNTLHTFGGGERLMLEMASRMKNDFEITIANPVSNLDLKRVSEQEMLKLYDLSGVKIVNIHAIGIERRAFGKEPYIMRILKPQGSFKLESLIRNTDIIYQLGLNPLVLSQSLFFSKAYSKRFILGVHNFTFAKLFEPNENGMGISKLLFRQMLRSATAYHVTNNRDLAVVKRHFPKAQVAMIPNFITVPITKPKLNRKEFVCLYVGRLELHQKGIDLLAEIMDKTIKKNNKVIFEIAGNGGEGEGLIKDLSTRFKKNIRWLGFVQKDKLEKIYDKANLVVVPSRNEAFSLVVVEAWTHALPVVTFDIPGPNDLIKKDFHGTLIKKFDTSAFSAAIEGYYKMWKGDKKFIARKEKIVEYVYNKYDAKIIIPELETFFLGEGN